MRIAKSSRFYGIIAGVAMTAGAGLCYALAQSKVTSLRDVGEGTPGEIASAMSATRLWLVIACVLVFATLLVALLPHSDDREDG